MTMRFEQILADGVAQTSYVVGDDGPKVAAVVDPQPDTDLYLEIARRYGLSITHVFKTHIHADFMSGARELVYRLGGPAKLCLSVEGGAGVRLRTRVGARRRHVHLRFGAAPGPAHPRPQAGAHGLPPVRGR